MIKIKVSYERPEELQRVVRILGAEVKRLKKPREKTGQFYKAYMEMKDTDRDDTVEH